MAELAPAALAVSAVPTGDVTLAGDSLADLEPDHVATELFDLAHELVADDHRHGDGRLRPRIPVVDVQIGAADRGLANADQNVAIAWRGLGYIFEPQAGFAARLDKCFHDTKPIAWPTRTNASIAVSMSVSVCAADI